MTRPYARAPKGQRAIGCAPAGHWKTTTIIGSIRLNGEMACMTLEGAVDTEAFVAYVEQVLCPTLRPGDIVVLDNLSSHKSPRVKRAIEAVHAEVRYLPPYSPDYNPIELMWSKVKAFLKAAATRTTEGLFQAIGQALQRIHSSDVLGWFRHCGYAPIQP